MRKVIEINEFDSEFCNVQYNSEDNVVLLTWKKCCSNNNYRNPTTFALDLLMKYPHSNFVIDTRNGFEDSNDDAKWGVSVLLPALSKTDCKIIVLIMNTSVDRKMLLELDMWTKEFRKYFTVKKTNTYAEAVDFISKHT
jgi:hypothetical protein